VSQLICTILRTSQPSMGSRSIRQNMAWKREKSSLLNKWHGSSKAKRW